MLLPFTVSASLHLAKIGSEAETVKGRSLFNI
jgi:hypothetical protein